MFIKQDDTEIFARTLFPETFPDGGLPHYFPEKTHLEQKTGYEDHHPENKKPYWSISCSEKNNRMKFISAIILKTPENKDNLPIIDRFEGNNFIGVRITQNGENNRIVF